MGSLFFLLSVHRFHWLQQQKYRKKGYQPNIYLREWAIKTELRYRARIYDPLEHEHKSIEQYEPPQDHQQTTGSTAEAANRDEVREEDTREEEENKSSLAHISNQMVMSIGSVLRERLSLNKFITVLCLRRRTRRYFGSSST